MREGDHWPLRPAEDLGLTAAHAVHAGLGSLSVPPAACVARCHELEEKQNQFLCLFFPRLTTAGQQRRALVFARALGWGMFPVRDPPAPLRGACAKLTHSLPRNPPGEWRAAGWAQCVRQD